MQTAVRERVSDGRFLLGMPGAERLSKIAEELNRKQLAVVNARGKKQFSQFRPWMSCANRIDDFIELPVFNSTDTVADTPKIIFEDPSLRELREAFYENEMRPMGGLNSLEEGYWIAAADNVNLVPFRRIFDEAMTLIRTCDESLHWRLRTLFLEYIPMERAPWGFSKDGFTGTSLHSYRGAIMTTPFIAPSYPVLELAVLLAHEIGHQACMVYQYADRLIEEDLEKPVFSAARKEDRPAIMSFHAIVALAYMLEFLNLIETRRDLNADEFLAQKKEIVRIDLSIGLNAMKGTRLTSLGNRMIDEITQLYQR